MLLTVLLFFSLYKCIRHLMNAFAQRISTAQNYAFFLFYLIHKYTLLM